jgi:hypothetical protein
MATNLTTIEVRLIANAQKFKKNVDQAKTKTKEFAKSTTNLKNKGKVAQESIRNLAGTIAAVQGPLGPVAGRLNSIGAILGRINIGAVIGVAAFTAIGLSLAKFAKAGADAERVSLRLQAIIKATGGAAQLSSRDIELLAESVAKNTLASVQGARQAAGVLLTFKSITGETFKDALRLSQDLAEVGFGSINTAALQLGKALEEPEIGLSALRRVGVSFTKDQKDLIKVLSLTGRKLEAQKIITKALDEQVGGAGVGAGGGLAGAFDTLAENINLFFERAAGTFVVDALTASLRALNDIVSVFVPELEDFSEFALPELSKRFSENKTEITKLENELKAFKNSTLGNIQSSLAFSTAQKFVAVRIERNIKALKAENRALKEQIDVKNGVNSIENQALDIFQKSRNKQIRTMGDQMRLSKELDEATKLRLKNEIQLRDALISKLGDSKVALEFIEALLEANKDKFQTSAEVVTEFNESLAETDKIATGVANEVTKVGDTIVDAFLRGEASALNFKNILRDLLISIQKTIIQVLILDRVNAAIRKGITGIFGPSVPTPVDKPITVPRATGGSVQSGTPALVGERGPELFVPRTAGAITPSSLTPGKMSGGGSVVINQNLNFALGVTNTVRSEIANLLPTIQQSTLSAVSDAKLRGGKFAKAFGG